MDNRPLYGFLLCCLALFGVLCSLALSNNFTGDSGDSITHYLYSHYAFVHPVLFLNHWAKPLFILLSSPFAQFGFAGIKIFNCLVASLSCYFTYLVARELKMKYTYLVLPFMFFCPLYFTLIFSGLTEYLFGLFLIVSIYLAIKEKLVLALLMVSFLPFIRSEGLILLGVFSLYLVVQKKWKYLPLLLIGHIIYSIIGYFHYHDLLWVFTKLPYANVHSNYGHGGPFDFVHILNYVIEKPMFILMGVGFFTLICRLFKKRKSPVKQEESILIYGGFAIFFIAHSVFWWKGIFSSGGFLMPRVMNAGVPLIALIALGGFNFVIGFIKNSIYRNVVVLAVTMIIVVFPFTSRAKGLVFDKNLFTIHENNMIDEKVVPYINKTFPDYKTHEVYYAHPYLSIALNIDPFDSLKHGELHTLFIDKVPVNTIVIWDDWFSKIEQGMTIKQLSAHKEFELLCSFEEQEKGRVIQYAIFKKANDQ
ncbi:MAG TPA: hypothetical protein VNZ45_15840 [Bacteroidia bacterium]|jgi:hypothetical protein|nr:hypothetical protein [Bacteroidia bacterium]